jgi:hypothetical protein
MTIAAGDSTQSAPMTTGPVTTAYGPIDALASIVAALSTTAVGWMGMVRVESSQNRRVPSMRETKNFKD